MVIEKPGRYVIPETEYHADPCIEPSLSRSVIKDLIYKSPAHAWHNHPRLNPNFKPEEEQNKFDIGTVAHALLFEGIEKFLIVDADDWRKKEAREKKDVARAANKIPLLSHQESEIQQMVISARKQICDCEELGITNTFEQGDSELSYIWQEEGLWMRARSDWINKENTLILDYKTTTQSANPSELGRQIASMGYDIQASFYSRGIKAIEKTNPKFIFIFQETSEPYLCSFIALPPEFIAMGNQKVNYGIMKWGECLSSGKWPGYPNRVAWVDPPPWALTSWASLGTDVDSL